MLVTCKWCGFSKDMPADVAKKMAHCPICSKEFGLAPKDRRTSERSPVGKIYAQIGLEGKCEVKDLALTGLSVYSFYLDRNYKIGAKITLDLISEEKTVLKELQAEVVYVSSEACGCKFVSLTAPQRAILERVIREGVQAQQHSDPLNAAISGLKQFMEKE